MLALRAPNYNISRTIAQQYKYGSAILPTSTVNMETPNKYRDRYISSISFGDALAPLQYNDIGYSDNTFLLNDTENKAEVLEGILTSMNNAYNNLNDKDLHIFKIYTKNVSDVLNRIDEEIFTTVDEDINNYYLKCNAQLELREDLADTPITEIRLGVDKHFILLVTDFYDKMQWSDTFLTIGLIPTLFSDYKSKFNAQELKYFEELVHRSQLKRIVNSVVTDLFQQIFTTDKYEESIKNAAKNAAISNLVYTAIENCRRSVSQASRNAEAALDTYAQAKREYYEASNRLDLLENRREEMQEEYKTAFNMEGIVDIDFNDVYNTIKIAFRAPVTFYDVDEVECMLHSVTDENLIKFFTKVFIENKYTLYLYSQFNYSTRGNNFQAPGNISHSTLNDYNAMYNPHTHFYGCLGDYKPRLLDAQAKQDLLLFNNIALASLKSINFRDGAVISRWKSDLIDAFEYDSLLININCLEDEYGNKYSIKDIVNDEEPQEPQPELTDEDNAALDAALAQATALANGTVETQETFTEEDEVALEQMIDEERHPEIEEEFIW